MAGMNAFPDLPEMRRIRREEIAPTLAFVAEQLAGLGLEAGYLRGNLLGSGGKQDDSGDLDIALGDDRFTRSILWDIASVVPHIHPEVYMVTRQIPGDMLITAWPVVAAFEPGGPVRFAEGRVQIDFFFGDAEWLKFTHWSPGRDRSPYPGVLINALLHQYGHLLPIFEQRDDRGTVARIEWYLDLFQGVRPVWKLTRQPGQEPSIVDPDHWETHVPTPYGLPVHRVARTGWIRDPEVAVRVLLGPEVTRRQIETFDGLWAVIESRHRVVDDCGWSGLEPTPTAIKRHLIAYLMSRTPLKKVHTAETLAALPVWAHLG